MHTGYLAVVGVSHVDIQTLTLVYEGTSVGGHVDYLFLRDLPGGLVEVFQVLGNGLTRLKIREDNSVQIRHVTHRVKYYAVYQSRKKLNVL